MGLNWRQAGQNMGAGMAQLGQQMVSAELQAQRDKNLARYKREEMTQGHTQQLELQGNQIDAQNFARHQDLIGGQQLAAQEAKAGQMQAETERQQELEDARREQEWKQDNIKLRGTLGMDKGVSVTNNMGGDDHKQTYLKEMHKGRAKADVEMMDTVRSEVKAAAGMESNLKVIEEVMDSAETGATPELMAKVGKWMGTEASTAMQTLEGASTDIVLGMASKLSGVISDKDMEIIERGAPSFGKNPEANRQIIAIIRRGIANSKANYNSMQKHLKANDNSLLDWEIPNSRDSENARTPAVDGSFGPNIGSPIINSQMPSVESMPSMQSQPTQGASTGQAPAGSMLNMFEQFEIDNPVN